jgi:hypothetical protein
MNHVGRGKEETVSGQAMHEGSSAAGHAGRQAVQ